MSIVPVVFKGTDDKGRDLSRFAGNDLVDEKQVLSLLDAQFVISVNELVGNLSVFMMLQL